MRDFPRLPEHAIPIVPVRNLVLFPGIILPLTVGRKQSVAAAQEATRGERPIGVVLQRNAEAESPTPDDLHWVGTVASVVRYITGRDGTHHLICQGEQRFRITQFIDGYPFLVGRIERIEEPAQTSREIEARMLQLKERAAEALQLLPQAPEELGSALQGVESASALADLSAHFMDLKPAEKQDILETFDVQARLDKVLAFLAHRLEVLRLSRDIGQRTKESMDERQREYLLREQLKAIQKELGETDQNAAEVAELSQAIAEAKMPAEADEHARKELRRLERMPEAAAEYSMVRTYLEWLTELPWSILTDSTIDIAEARKILDEDHYGLAKIKRRILEYLAVRKLNPEGKSPILCFVGPPGVGKTSLGQSIARATDRKFIRISLGGVHDEAEIRGHRRTYIGALPGNIIQAIRKAGTRNPVFMLDEMDKLGAGFHGDPSSALLEVLDPEQNATFRDNYLALPFDLSKVMFIGTANILDTIPGPLRDRMEVIQLPGYTEEEKIEIARRYLVKRQLEANGLSSEQSGISDDALRAIIHDYTREAGVRNLERQIGTAFRSAAMRIAEGATARVDIEAADLHSVLGAKQFESEIAMRTSTPGVATGLAWTPVGGDIL
ncbi:MAG: endopeptidase La, partial [Gammaproteobacteria bacterium]